MGIILKIGQGKTAQQEYRWYPSKPISWRINTKLTEPNARAVPVQGRLFCCAETLTERVSIPLSGDDYYTDIIASPLHFIIAISQMYYAYRALLSLFSCPNPSN